MRYATRNHAFVPATTWELSKNMLQWEEENRPPQALAVTEIRQVRLEFAPTRPEPNRYRCRLVLRNGTTKDFYNRTYRGLYDFFDTSAEYVKFVEALHATLVVHAPGCEFVAGVAKANYVFSWVSTVFGGICILIAAQYLVLNGLALLLFLKIALLAYFGPNVYRWFVRNKPRTYNPVAIPVNVLPQKDSSWFTEPP